MSELEIQHHIATLQKWLEGAWRRLGDPSLTMFDKRHLRHEMKQADAALRRCLALAFELKFARKTAAIPDDPPSARPALRFLA